MDFMGIGPLELILILILGFLFFGPEKLPGMAAKAGKLYRNFRKATFDMSKSLSEELSVEDKRQKESTALSLPELAKKTNNVNAPTTISPPTTDEKPHD